MKNAAGDSQSNGYILKEMAEAHLNIIQHAKMIPDVEIRTHFEGELHGWRFRRAWYYWIASCSDEFNDGLELKYSEPLHDLIGKEVRLAGHCGCPSPASDNFLWCTIFTKERNIVIPKKMWNQNIKILESIKDKSPERLQEFKDEFVPMYAKDIRKSEHVAKIVTNSYHIDTQEGLNIFTNVLKKRHRDTEYRKKDEEARKRHREYCEQQQNKKQ